ncbi:MAG: hypothetical protein K2K58_00210 [Muribaculaceae bacterium]|nr:hypothetical protein [Muribaculaceae bacterium]
MNKIIIAGLFSKIERCCFITRSHRYGIVIELFQPSLFTLPTLADTTIVRMMEGGIIGRLTTTLGDYHARKAKLSGTIGIERRCNFKGLLKRITET